MGVTLRQPPPLRGISRFVVGNHLFEHGVFGIVAVQHASLNPGMHRQISPGRHTQQIGVNGWRHVGLRPHERHQRLRPCLQEPGMRIGTGAVAQQRHRLAALLDQLERQMRDKREAIAVVGHQTGKRVLAHDGCSVLGVVELLGEIHAKTVPKERHLKVPYSSFPLNCQPVRKAGFHHTVSHLDGQLLLIVQGRPYRQLYRRANRNFRKLQVGDIQVK